MVLLAMLTEGARECAAVMSDTATTVTTTYSTAEHGSILLILQVELLRIYAQLELREDVKMLGHIRAYHAHHFFH